MCSDCDQHFIYCGAKNSGLEKQPKPLPNIGKADSTLARASDGYQRQQIRQLAVLS
jgi:hypothetical protein